MLPEKTHICPLLSSYLKDLGSFEHFCLILGGELLKEKKPKPTKEQVSGEDLNFPIIIKRKITQQLPIALKYVINNHPMFEVNAKPKNP